MAAAAMLVGCQPAAETAVKQTEQLRVTAQPISAKVERRDIVGYTLLTGELYVPPSADVAVNAPYTAPVGQVLTSVGQRVRKGEDLIKMSTPDVDASYSQASANVKAAETAYANALQNYKAATREAEQQLAQARDSERQWRTAAAQSGDATTLNEAIAARQQAEAALMQARQQAQADLQPYKQQLDAARSTYKQNRSVMKQTAISAPISGVVTELAVTTGQQVSTGARMLRVTDLGAIKVQSDVPESAQSLIREGKDVVITFVGLEDKPFEGHVTNIKAIPSPAGTMSHRALIDFKNDDGLVKPGAVVKAVGIKMGEVHDVLAVPAAAVVYDKTGRPVVNRLVGGKWIEAQSGETRRSDRGNRRGSLLHGLLLDMLRLARPFCRRRQWWRRDR